MIYAIVYYTIDANFETVTLTYYDATVGWIVSATNQGEVSTGGGGGGGSSTPSDEETIIAYAIALG